jgi:Kef-type K+ transport system membrane component KefB
MPEISLTGVLVVAAVAFAVPLGLGLFPSLRIPSVVLEIVAGIVIGPQVLGLVEVDLPLQVLALIGLAFLLFLAGLEIDLDRLRGRLLKSAATGFALSVAVAFAIASGLWASGLVRSPLLVAIILSATALGIVVPVLADAGRLGTPLGQLIIAAASIADFGAIVLLSLFFSGEATSVWSTLLLLVGFVLLAIAVGVAITEVGRSARLGTALRRLQDSSAQIRVRGAFLLLVGLVVGAGAFLYKQDYFKALLLHQTKRGQMTPTSRLASMIWSLMIPSSLLLLRPFSTLLRVKYMVFQSGLNTSCHSWNRWFTFPGSSCGSVYD